MKCQCKECKGEQLVHLGGTVGGIQLYGCPKCFLVYYWEPRLAYQYEEKARKATERSRHPVLAGA